TTVDLAVIVDGGERIISSTRLAAPARIENLFTRAFSVADVPTELPLRLRIVVRSRTGRATSHTESYVLHYPDYDRIKAVGVQRALDDAGHLGDFVVDPTRATVARVSSSP